MSAPIIMVHGAFCGGWSFEAFKTPFEAAGYICNTPDLPGHEAGARTGAVAGVSMSDYARFIVAQIEACETPPILMGHSLGGLVALMAATKTRVSAIILLAPSAPWGVASNSMEDAVTTLGMMGISAYWGQAVDPDRSVFEAYSVDRLPPIERKAAFDRLTPESGRALSEAINWWMDPFMTTSVTASQITAPVLLIAGGRDRIQTASTVSQTAERYGAQLKVFPEMSHWVISEPGWKDVAQTCLAWIPSVVSVDA